MSEKTEQPTPKRIRDSREKGDVCKGQDLAPAATVLALVLYAVASGERIYEELCEMVLAPFEVMHLPFGEALARCAGIVVDIAVGIVLPVVGVVMGAALVVLLAETGFLFAPKAAMPKLENLSPAKWFKRVFSMKNLFEFVKNVIKVAVIGTLAWNVLNKYIPLLFSIPKGGASAMWTVLGQAAAELLLMTSGAFAVIAAIDYLYQKWRWTHDHMMSIDEVKREYKESEGDPVVKSQRKQLQRELMNQNTLGNVRKAKVLVTNPTHYAVALDYDKDSTPLPVILAKGEGALAQRMIEVAKEEGIPIMRNVPLARALYRDGAENAYIPRDLIGPVAEVLRWVQGLEEGSGR